MTKPVLITVVEYSSPVLRKGATIAAGISTEMIPTNLSAGRREPVDQLGLVGPQDKTEQSVLPGSGKSYSDKLYELERHSPFK